MKRFNAFYKGFLIMLAFMVWSSDSVAIEFDFNMTTGFVELTIGGPLVGGERIINLPTATSVVQGTTSPREVFLADMTTLSEQFSVTVDEAVSTVSGCIRDPDGKPIVGALVLGIKPDSLQPATFAVTAGGTGVGVYGFPPFNWPVPATGLVAGCYTMVIPPGLMDFITTVGIETAQLIGAKLGDQTGSVTAISVTAFIPGYALDPGVRHIGITPMGVLEETSAGESSSAQRRAQ